MTITDLKTFVVNPGHRVSFGTGWGKNWIFVKLYTDQGLEGVGEVFSTGQDLATVEVLEGFKRVARRPRPHARHSPLAGPASFGAIPDGHGVDGRPQRRGGRLVGPDRQGVRRARLPPAWRSVPRSRPCAMPAVCWCRAPTIKWQPPARWCRVDLGPSSFGRSRRGMPARAERRLSSTPWV